MTKQRQHLGVRFCCQWLVLSTAGYSLGYLAGFLLGHFLLGNVMIGVGIGAGVGGMQWLLLRRFADRAGWWTIAPVIGLAASLSLYSVASSVWGVPFDLSRPFGILGWALALASGGALAGILQQPILEPHSGWRYWWVASAVGWCLSAMGLAIPADMSGQYSSVAMVLLRNGMLAPAVAGIILGAVTGFPLTWRLSPDYS